MLRHDRSESHGRCANSNKDGWSDKDHSTILLDLEQAVEEERDGYIAPETKDRLATSVMSAFDSQR